MCVCVCVCVWGEIMSSCCYTRGTPPTFSVYLKDLQCAALLYSKIILKDSFSLPFPFPVKLRTISNIVIFFFCKKPQYLHLNDLVCWECLALSMCMYANLECMGFKYRLVSIVMACHYFSTSFTTPPRPPTVLYWERDLTFSIDYQWRPETTYLKFI